MTLSNLISHLPTHLPSQRAIANAFAPRTYRSTSEYAGMLSLGLIAGAALTLALAPNARRELRKRVSERYKGLRSRVKKGRQWINGRAEERIGSAAS
jgi:hypothetical protein